MLKKFSAIKTGLVAASVALASSAHAAIDPTVTDGALADIAVMGGLMVALTIAVTAYSYVKRTAR